MKIILIKRFKINVFNQLKSYLVQFTEYLRMKKHPSILRACRITTQKFLYFAVFLAALLRGTYFAAPVSKYLARLNVYSHFLRILKFMTIWISFNCPWKISIWLATFFPWIIRYLPFAKQNIKPAFTGQHKWKQNTL